MILTFGGANKEIETVSIFDKLNDMKKQNRSFSKTLSIDSTSIDSERNIVACISKKVCDTDGDLILSINFDLYNKNPVLLVNHNIEGDTIAICKKTWETQDGFYASFHFPERPVDYKSEWVPDTYLSKIKSGLMTAFSIGALPLITRKPTNDEKKRYKSIIESVELENVYEEVYIYEVSLVNIPANSECHAILPESGGAIETNKGFNKKKTVIIYV